VRKSDFFNEYDAGSILRTFVPVLIDEEPGFEADVAQMATSNRSFEKVFEKVLQRWFAYEGDGRDFESWASFTSRVQCGIRQLMDREGSGKRVALFTSGGPISAVVQKALGLSNQSTISIAQQIVNSSVSRFKYNGEAVMLFGFNDITHLELDDPDRLITYR
jgi:broad specificity phosphatase PhoE